MTTLTVGQDLDAWCIKCKLKLAHVLVSLNKSNRPHRVQCKTCEDVHAYRVKAASARTKKPSTPQPTEYDRMIKGRDLSKAIPYDIRSDYSRDDFITHKTLGLGLVTGSRGEQKIEVLFPEGPKLLMCGR